MDGAGRKGLIFRGFLKLQLMCDFFFEHLVQTIGNVRFKQRHGGEPKCRAFGVFLRKRKVLNGVMHLGKHLSHFTASLGRRFFYVSSAEAGSNGAWLAVDFGKQAAVFARNGITYCKAFFTEMTGQFKIVRKLIFVQTFENGKDVLTFVGVQVKITVFNTAGYTF